MTDGDYTFYPGYWGPTVGFYGGVNYGFGYTGVGYDGGYWRNNQFVYNSAVNNLGSANIVNAFSRPVSNPNNRVAFSGGGGGTIARATQAQIAARARAMPPTAVQTRHEEMASRDPALRFDTNHGQPRVAAMQRANEFHGAQATAATNVPAERPQAAASTPPAHPGAAEHAPAARPGVAEHAPAARPSLAYHAPGRRAFVAPRHFAYHGPAIRAAPHFGGMRIGGAPHLGGMRMGAAPHFGGGPHGGGGGGRRVP